MKALLHAISLVAIAAAAFFSLTNKSKFEEQQKIRRDLVSSNRGVSADKDKTQKELDNVSDELTAAKEAKAEVEANLERSRSDERQLKREEADLEGTLAEQKEELGNAEAAAAEVRLAFEALGLPGGQGLDAVAENIQKLEDDKKSLMRDIGELETTIEAAERSIEKNQEEIARLGRKASERKARFRNNSLESVITAVDQDWGFVVIGAGSNTGFTPQTRLIVKRSGRAIAEVKPSSIEPTQTIAEIDWDTLSPGVRLQPGDRVILAETATN